MAFGQLFIVVLCSSQEMNSILASVQEEEERLEKERISKQQRLKVRFCSVNRSFIVWYFLHMLYLSLNVSLILAIRRKKRSLSSKRKSD